MLTKQTQEIRRSREEAGGAGGMQNMARPFFNMLRIYGKVGCIGFGGGSALIPILERETVTQGKLLSPAAYQDHVIVANITPGALPVKLAAAGGRQAGGLGWMAAAATMVSVPGVVGTVGLVAALSRVDSDILTQIEFLAVGIAVFIISLLVDYVGRVLRDCRKQGRLAPAALVALAVLLLTCGKEARALLGISGAPVFDLSTIHTLVLAFFIIFYIGGTPTRVNAVVSAVTAALFLLCTGKASPIDAPWVLPLLEGGMLALALYATLCSVREQRGRRAHTAGPWLELGAWLLVLAAGCAPALLTISGTGAYLTSGLMSTVMSFGGGEAYLTVADGMFVTAGVITPEEFYSQLLPVANALPGPILSKLLTGVGYYVGLHATGTVGGGLCTALAGYAVSLAGSCGIFFCVMHLYRQFQGLPVFQTLKRWILPIICGLLLTTVLSMSLENQAIGHRAGLSGGGTLVLMGLIYILNAVLSRTFHLHEVLRIILCGGAAFLAFHMVPA